MAKADAQRLPPSVPPDVAYRPLPGTLTASDTVVLGYRADATWAELVDEATLREEAVDHLLSVLSAAELGVRSDTELAGSFRAIRLLCRDAAALHREAYHRMREHTVDD